MTTIGRGSTAKIAGACDDGTVRVYDSVTGALRLSLRPELPILEMAGSADGWLLVCTHSGRHSITLWDIQTGGLVHTFILEGEVKHTAISLKGRYLACEASENTVNFWETASRKQHPDPLEKLEGNTPCWLAPENLIMVVDRGLAYIRNVVTKGLPVHKFTMPGTSYSAIYSQTFNLLAAVSPHPIGRSFVILDVKTGGFSALRGSGGRQSLIAFSQTTKQLVCGSETPGLETVDISTGRWTHFDFPATLTSISTLTNGTVVANVRGSGIQLLRLDQEHASPQQPTPPLTMYPLDKGRIISIVPATNDRVILLETSTMSQVFSAPTQRGDAVHVTVLCASLENKIAVYCFAGAGRGYLQMWEFSRGYPRWTEPTSEPPSVCGLSPACTRLATFHNGRSRGFVCVWDMSNGSLVARTFIENSPPLDITFDSEDRFYFYDITHREPYIINTSSQTGDPTIPTITPLATQRLDGQVLEKYYYLDEGREWVICGSQRICWVPPGYVGHSYCWAGSSLVMVGQGGTLRRLTFLESSS